MTAPLSVEGFVEKVPRTLLNRIVISEAEACWEWTGSTNQNYGIFEIKGKEIRIHRFIYELMVGPIPKELTIDHLCRNRRCVNPVHLEVVTRKENTLRGVGPTAINAKATHCKYGHPFDKKNTRRAKCGSKGRVCRKCVARWAREKYQQAIRAT